MRQILTTQPRLRGFYVISLFHIVFLFKKFAKPCICWHCCLSMLKANLCCCLRIIFFASEGLYTPSCG